MAFSNQELARITGYTGLFGEAAKQAGQCTHQDHVIALGEKVKQGDRDAFDRLNKMNQYFDQQGMGGYKFNVPSLPQPEPQPQPQLQPLAQPQQQTFDKAKLAQISGYDQTPMFRGFGGTVDTAMGKGRHGNYVFDLLGQVRRGGENAADARAKLEAMNRYFDSIPGYSGAKIDIDGASFSDKPVNRELRQVTGYTGFFGPDAKEGEKFGDYVRSLRDAGDFDAVAKVNEVLQKYGYGGFEVKVGEDLSKRAKDLGYQGDPNDIDAIGRFMSNQGSKISYIDEYGQLTPTGRQALLQDNPELPEGTQLSLFQYKANQDEFLETDKYKQTPTKYNVDAAQAAVDKAVLPGKDDAATFAAQTATEEVAKAQVQAARQQGLTDYVDAQQAEVDVNATIQGQLANLMQQFEGGQIPAFAAGAIRVAEQRLAARGMGASSMAGAAIMQAAMEATTPIAAADAETYRRMSELNLNNRQQAEVLNAQMTLQLDLQNLTNEQQTRVTNNRNQVQALFSDQAAVNASRQFNAQTEQQNDQFFANLFNQTARFNTTQQNAMAQFNAGQTNARGQFNAELANQREQFQTKNSILIDQANAVYRRQINTANTAIQNAEAEVNTRNLFNLSTTAMANVLQQHRDELQFARTSALNEDEFNYNLAHASFAFDKNLELAADVASGSLFTDLATTAIDFILEEYSG